jgi:hypothetical protein
LCKIVGWKGISIHGKRRYSRLYFLHLSQSV